MRPFVGQVWKECLLLHLVRHSGRSSIHVRRNRNLRPVDFKRGQEPSQRFVCRSNDARMESVACCQGDAIESFSFEGFHDVLNGLCSTCNNGHLRRVLVGSDDVTFCSIKDTFNSIVWAVTLAIKPLSSISTEPISVPRAAAAVEPRPC